MQSQSCTRPRSYRSFVSLTVYYSVYYSVYYLSKQPRPLKCVPINAHRYKAWLWRWAQPQVTGVPVEWLDLIERNFYPDQEEIPLPLPPQLKSHLEDDCFWILRRNKVRHDFWIELVLWRKTLTGLEFNHRGYSLISRPSCCPVFWLIPVAYTVIKNWTDGTVYHVDGFQMSIKCPTSRGQERKQKAVVQRAFYLEEKQLFYLSIQIVRTQHSAY